MNLRIVTDDGPEEIYFTCQELAKRWKCSKATVYRRVKAGQLDTINEGTSLMRVEVASVLRYEAARKNLRRAS